MAIPEAEAFFKNVENDFDYGATVANSSTQIRLGFIRKVYGILSFQLLLTTLVGAFFMYNETATKFVQGNPNILFAGMITSIGLIIALGIKRKEAPTNIYLLIAFTFVEAYTIGTVAFGLTFATVVALTVYTFQSKKDFSTLGASLFSVLWILIVASIMQIFIRSETIDLVLAVVGALVFSGFIVFDTHMLLHKLSPEEYILASINLYLDIINLFLQILKILNSAKK